ncbi:HAMP domain-containing protein [Fortiea sp. LEGE XX443]|uniref:sensor histidine kinase n=1 Tax=Fortiea sp. LEGE XX443 TaxID=1828611 RepID=UPI00187E9EFC|nr:ATP-binding protein [Fortiea sp. LEGE XX443]MBE9004304.1 HAMP domain-containing protein [Fortiea sp. LEGE XX443]
MRKSPFRLNLRQKIVLPFLTVFLGVFILCLFMVGHWFTENLEQSLYQKVASFAERIHQDLKHEQEHLEILANLIVEREAITSAVEQQDKQKLLQILLPLKTILGLDWIKVVDTKGNILLDARKAELIQAKLLDRAIINSAINGAGFTDFIDVEESQKVLQVVIHPIKSSTKLLGGIIIGHLLNDQLLQKIVIGSSKEIIATQKGRIVAATLPKITHLKWQPPSPNLSNTIKVVINQQQYLAKSVFLEAASQSVTITVIYPISELETTKILLWLRLVFLFLLGGTFVTIVGFIVAQTITRPLYAVTNIAKQVTKDSNFDLQAPIITQDEVGILATSLNQLIQQVKQLLLEQYQAKVKLEAYSQTLEQKVKERTEEIQQKNIDLKQTLKELKQTQLQLIQTEKMSSLGQLVAGVAHEINNPVTFIYGNLEYAEQYIQDILNLIQLYQQHYPHPHPHIQKVIEEVDLEYLIEDLPKILISMQVGAERIHQIVLSLRIFSRLDEAEFKAANIHDGIDSTLLILQHRLKAQTHRPEIQVIKEYCELPQIYCFVGQLNQVFMNILANAIDALDEAWENGLSPHPFIRISSEYNNENIIIRVADNGIGIPKELQQRLFDPFFTTKPIGKGTGLGLSISYQIVTEKHGGLLECISSTGKGTEFVITLPNSRTKPFKV